MIKKTFIRIYDTDIGYSFFNSKIAIISSSVFFIISFWDFNGEYYQIKFSKLNVLGLLPLHHTCQNASHDLKR